MLGAIVTWMALTRFVLTVNLLQSWGFPEVFSAWQRRRDIRKVHEGLAVEFEDENTV
jgi:hypothetical protein